MLASLAGAKGVPPEGLKSPDGKWQIEQLHKMTATGEASNPGEDRLCLVPLADAAEKDGVIFENAESVESASWSPDSRFFVIAFAGAGYRENKREHQIMVLRIADRSMRSLNGYFFDGFVSAADIGFEREHDVVLSIQLYPEETPESEDGQPQTVLPVESLPMHVDLEEAFPLLLPSEADDGPANAIEKLSPDGTLKAVALRTPNPAFVARRDADSFRLAIVSVEGDETIYSFDLSARRQVDQMRWSPDSRFLVLTTESSGGHSPMNERTFVYCRDDDSFRSLSDYRPHLSVTCSDIGFAGANTAILGVWMNRESDEFSTTYPTVAVPLGRDYLKMEQERSESAPKGFSPALTLASPDGKWFAAARADPDARDPLNADLDGFRLVIQSPAPPDAGDQVKGILQIHGSRQELTDLRWSPDSCYLVVVLEDRKTKKLEAWVWSSANNSLRRLSQRVLKGSLADCYFSSPGVLECRIAAKDDESVTREISLDDCFKGLPEVKSARRRK